MLNLAQIQTEIDSRAAIIGASGYTLPTYNRPDGDGRPHIEITEDTYHYVVEERGKEYSRISTQDLDELLYHVFQDVTHSLAGAYEVQHRIQGQDIRRQLFKHQIELLLQLSDAWCKRCIQEQLSVLREYPFDDASHDRVRLTTSLRAKGHSAEEAWRLACETYPLP